MPETKVQYIVELLKQGSLAGAEQELNKLTAAQKQAEAGAGSLTATAGKLRAAFGLLAGSLAVRELIQFGAASVRAMEEQDRAIQRLEGSMRAVGQYSEEYSRSLQRQASALQDLTNVGDELINNTQAQLISFGAERSEINRLTQDVLDLSAGLGGDLNSATMLVGKALQGEFGAFSRYGITLYDTASRAEKLEQALRAIEQRFGGGAAATADQRGGFRELKTVWGDFQEEIGGFLADILAPAVRTASSAIREATTVLQQARAITQGPAGLIGGFLTGQLTGAIGQIGSGANAARSKLDPELAKREQEDLQRLLKVQSAENFAPVRLGAQGLETNPNALRLLRQQAQSQLDLTNAQADAGIVREADALRRIDEISAEYSIGFAKMAEAGRQIDLESRAAIQGARDEELLRINQDYKRRRELVSAYYEWQREKAGENALAQEMIRQREAEAIAAVDAAQRQHVRETSVLYQEVLLPAAQQFASGFAHSIVEGIRTGRFAFAEFASNFMAQIAEMILQVLIFRAIWSALAPGPMKFMGAGGFAPRVAAAGLAGVEEVSGPTFFPRFNVLAGEAGREMLTVLARPQMVARDGVLGVEGMAMGNRLRITRAPVFSVTAPRFAADGFTSPFERAAGSPSTLNSQPSTGLQGRAVIEIRVSPRAEADIREQAIEGAHLKVLNDLHEDTPMSQAVKGLTR